MGTPMDKGARACNLMLACLSGDEYAALEPHLQRVQLHRKEVVGERGVAPSHVYFPCGGVLSVLTFMESGVAVEVGTIGREGFFGLEVLLGSKQWTETTLCQVEGPSLRMSADAFLRAAGDGTGLRSLAQRYLLAYMALLSQSVACNRLHTIEERFARWMLMTHDRVDGDSFYLTQEFIADMLGGHRPSVSLVAGAFQQAGFLKYSRGQLSISNRAGLEDAACECYAASRAQFRDLYFSADKSTRDAAGAKPERATILKEDS